MFLLAMPISLLRCKSPAKFCIEQRFYLQMRQFLLVDGRKGAAPQQSVHGFYDKRAFAILREAMNMGCLPALKLGSGGSINLRGTPPVVAEVFFLEVLATVVEGERR